MEDIVIAKNFSILGINPEGKEGIFSLKDFLGFGKKLILYFYPRNNTSG